MQEREPVQLSIEEHEYGAFARVGRFETSINAVGLSLRYEDDADAITLDLSPGEALALREVIDSQLARLEEAAEHEQLLVDRVGNKPFRVGKGPQDLPASSSAPARDHLA